MCYELLTYTCKQIGARFICSVMNYRTLGSTARNRRGINRTRSAFNVIDNLKAKLKYNREINCVIKEGCNNWLFAVIRFVENPLGKYHLCYLSLKI